ncbi:putative ribonuclease H protein [Camellia lanceoleosa]|uniref:Ribonuclease H protein n=1 Tax=Camellia lanceoleosa TaxID=1840588 RepID=A0ACC0FEU5_9ERIC|nr:putative ribonuclease H protein [Camellia lanceoleosa]
MKTTGQENKAGARGIIRTADGKWVFGFQHFIGCTTVVAAELWALWIGFQLTWDGGFRAVVVETRSLDAIKAVGIIDQMDPNFNICQEIKDLMSRDWQCHLQVIRRGANECADSLAKTVVH